MRLAYAGFFTVSNTGLLCLGRFLNFRGQGVTRGSWQDRSEMSMEYIFHMVCHCLVFRIELEGMCHVEHRLDELVCFVCLWLSWYATVVGSVWFHDLLFTVWQTAAIIPCCKGDPKMSSNGDLQDVGSWDSFWEVSIPHSHTHTHLPGRVGRMLWRPARELETLKERIPADPTFPRALWQLSALLFFKHTWSGPYLPWKKRRDKKSS